MKKGESRFFLNWQMSPQISTAIAAAKSDADRRQLCSLWLAETKIQALT